ncbi:MAG TPA: UvrD-helicase domain-containing protein [Terriglobia bacterium]|jgi:DNA helicase-2/ATP-dependent DNA helicase PcrA|nr:UvrD-helicase domain-containing protein [Terriglobia bacterium]
MPDLLEQLNSEQRAVAEQTEGPLLVLAGAGSGKTRAIIYRIAHLIENHRVPAWNILAVTFTNKAADQMRDRVVRLLGERQSTGSESPGSGAESPGTGLDGRAKPQVSTFHSLCVRILRREIEPLGYGRDFAIYDEDDQTRLLKACLTDLGLSDRLFTPRQALSRISRAKNQGMGPEELYQNARDPETEMLASIFGRYRERLRSANALDFDDLLLKTVELFDKSAELAESYSRRFRYIHVDEYQDTNRVQYRLIRQLTRAHHNICAVGDEDQSIYSWRGASIENILRFEEDFREARVLRLERNYRSTQVILDGASAVVSNNLARKGKKLWTERRTGRAIGLYQAGTAEGEAEFIAGEVTAALAADPAATVGVLYRTNAQSRLLEEAMRARRIAYRLVGGFSFYARAEIRDALAYARLAFNPRDTAAFLRILNTPPRGIGETTLAQLQALARENRLTLWEALEETLTREASNRAGRALRSFHTLMRTLAEEGKNLRMSEFFRSLLERTGYLAMLKAENSPEAEGRTENLLELVNAVAAAEEGGEGLTAFLDRAALVSDTDDYDERARVTLMTLHSAKGLEFSSVFLAGLEEGLLPHKMSMEDDAGLEEERRLCYVGMTRAKDRLALTSSATRRFWGEEGRRNTRRSRFLGEIPDKFTERLSSSGRVEPSWQGALNSRESIEHFLQTTGFDRRLERGGSAARAASGSAWRRGNRVRHPKYGVGTVIACEGEGEEEKLTVTFPGYGAKKLLPRFAALEKA